MKPLILLGGGGHCKSVIEAARSYSRPIAGIIDVSEKVGQNVIGVPIIGTEECLPSLANDYEFIVAVGFIKDPTLHNSLYRKILNCGGIPGTIIASTATVSEYAQIGRGTVVLHGAHVNAEALVGENAIINTNANIEHDAVIGDNCHISTCASINGGAHVGDSVFIGSHAVIIQGINICDNAIVGAGAIVCSDISEPGIYVGGPYLRKLK